MENVFLQLKVTLRKNCELKLGDNMILERKKYRKLRKRISSLPYYWQMYRKTFPANSNSAFQLLELDYFFFESGKLKDKVKVPFSTKVYVKDKQYEKLIKYAEVSRKLRVSIKKNKAILFK